MTKRSFTRARRFVDDRRPAAATSALITPDVYARWRATPLGALVESLETRVVVDLAGPLAGKRVLDAGTGDGTYAIEAAARGAEVAALDASPMMLEATKARAEKRGVSLRLHAARVERLPFEAERFDVVFAITVLCVAKDPARSRACWFPAAGW